MLCRLSLTQNHSALSQHICMRMRLPADAETQARTHLCMYSCLQLRGTPQQLWCGSRRRAQKTSRLMKVAELFQWLSACYTTRRNTRDEGTRVRVNIHVIAMKQLLGKIRSVITGMGIKWEFFSSEATCYSTNRGEREGNNNEGGQWTDGRTTTRKFSSRLKLNKEEEMTK